MSKSKYVLFLFYITLLGDLEGTWKTHVKVRKTPKSTKFTSWLCGLS